MSIIHIHLYSFHVCQSKTFTVIESMSDGIQICTEKEQLQRFFRLKPITLNVFLSFGNVGCGYDGYDDIIDVLLLIVLLLDTLTNLKPHWQYTTGYIPLVKKTLVIYDL